MAHPNQLGQGQLGNQMSDYQNAASNQIYAKAEATQIAAGTEKLHMMREDVRDVANRLESLSDRLFGASPPQVSGATGGPIPVPNGALQAMGDAMSQLSNQINRIRQIAGKLEELA